MIKIIWEDPRGVWKGECARCGVSSFFRPAWSQNFSDGTTLDVVECTGGHTFVICTRTGSTKRDILFVTPISDKTELPIWLPEQYQTAYREMMFDFLSGKYRSAVAIAGIILDGHISSLLKYRGDKKKPLKKRLEILANEKLIDQDQFADGTVARLSRNEVIHPEDVINEITEQDAKDVLDAVLGCIERFYRWRRAKALPAPAEMVADPSTIPEDGEVVNAELV